MSRPVSCSSFFRVVIVTGRIIIQLMDRNVKENILAAAKSELLKHSLSTFTDDAPPRVVVTGCASCRQQFGTINQLMNHLADDVLPLVLRRAFAIANGTLPR